MIKDRKMSRAKFKRVYLSGTRLNSTEYINIIGITILLLPSTSQDFNYCDMLPLPEIITMSLLIFGSQTPTDSYTNVSEQCD